MPRRMQIGACPVVPWKNGGGTTTELLVEPRGAGLDAFDWRISLARIDRDGAFSTFAGVDRTLMVIEGAVELERQGELSRLDPSSEPYRFPGEDDVHAVVVSGPSRDINVFTRRPRFAHRAWRIAAHDALPPAPDGALRVIVSPGPAADGPDAGEFLVLRAGEAVPPSGHGEERARIVIAIWPVGPAAP